MKSKPYNGHKNYTYWNTSLWIANDYGLYQSALHHIKTNKNKRDAAKTFLAELPEKTPDGAKYNFSNVRAALVGLE